MSFTDVSIIGAGLSGLSLALFLKQKHDITSTIYELRPADTTSDGAVMLSPNALRSLDTLGLYSRIVDRGFSFRHLNFNTPHHETVDKYEMGNREQYGYDALRIYRQILLDEFKKAIADVGIEIVYGKKFSHVVSEAEEKVTFAFQDGEERETDLLIGADGIHSTVRGYLAPGVAPAFSGFMAITGSVRTAQIDFPFPDYPLPAGIHGSAGAFVLAPQDPEGNECLAGVQYKIHDRSRADWDALFHDKAQLKAMIKENHDAWNPMVRSAMDAMPLENLSIWPFYTVPSIEQWFSKGGRVIMLGDSAHAIPPAAGQGVNQAFEDAHSLALVLTTAVAGKGEWLEALRWWQSYRQARVEKIQTLTSEMNTRRMPGWYGKGAESIDSSWLFSVDVEEDVKNRTERR